MAARDVVDMLHERIARILQIRRAALSILLERPGDSALPNQVTWRDWEDLARYWTPLLPDDEGAREEIASLIREEFGGYRGGTEAFEEPRAPEDEVLNSLDWLELRCGETLVRQGEASQYLFVLISGRISITVEPPDGVAKCVGIAGSSEVLGEMEFISGQPYAATLEAIRDSEAVRVPHATLARLASEDPLVWRALAKSAIQHIDRHINKDVSGKTAVTFAIAPAGLGTATGSFAEKLAAALSAAGRVRHLNSASVDAGLGPGAAQTASGDYRQGQLTRFLAAQEADCAYLIYECDPSLSEWTGRCLRQADRILFVGSVSAEPALNEIEAAARQQLSNTIKRAELVLLRAGEGPGAAAWLEQRQPRLVHNVDPSRPADLERVARLITGRGYGLVLGGGGARGFAHIGVIRAFREAGIPIDIVGGTSMGSCIAACCAMGWDYKEMLERNRQAWLKMRPFRDYTIPFLSLLSGKRLAKSFVFLFGEQRIEDLNIPYYAVSADLVMAETVVHQSGLLWKAVRASGSVAGVFPPVAGEGRLLIDGGVLNNLPVDVMQEVCGGGEVMAVDVNPYGYVTFWRCPPYGESFGALSWIRRAFASKGKDKGKIPGIHEILERTTTLASVSQAARAVGKLSMYLRPPTDQFGFLDAESIETIADLGYQFARPDLQVWMETRTVMPAGK